MSTDTENNGNPGNSRSRNNKNPGICYIKQEFVIQSKDDEKEIVEKSEINPKRQIDKVEKNLDGDDDKSEATKKFKKFEKGRGKTRGQNKNRPIFKEDRSFSLCRSKLNGPSEEKCQFPNCIYMHDIPNYLNKKPADIGDTCYVYSVKGFCLRGLTCRFGKSHMDSNFQNMKSENYNANAEPTIVNGISNELQAKLRKYNYDFSKTKELVQKYERLQKENSSNNTEKPIGSVEIDQEEINGRDIASKKKIDFRNKLLLSPLTTVGNLPFRRICKEFGADITCGEMACSVPIIKGMVQEWVLTKRHKSEDIFGVQLCGNSALLISQAAQLAYENLNIDFIDLNIGCPIDLIYKQGGGSALMRRAKLLDVVTKTCCSILNDVPFTVKTRTGVYADKSVAHELIPQLEKCGASAVTVHGRSREQRYTKNANWEYIEKCAMQAKTIPIIGNGDIMSLEDYNERKELAPHVSSVMIGRGALMKPWIFKEIKEQKNWDPSSTERYEILQKYVNYGMEHWGSDIKGVETTRRFLLEWLSFLYRYIPYGLIETPPQKINQRPEKYRGRDEMEDLMSSPNCTDWIKLSEKLLGPVPDGFSFLPKHKANSYA